MDRQCFYLSPSLQNGNCELLDDVQEPSLPSLDGSSPSSRDFSPSDREDCFSEGEARHSTMNIIPTRNMGKRRSVSLVDISKIDAYTAKPLGKTLPSWETMGSQSSVGKSRDSGYHYSGSLLSVNSGKLSESKVETEKMDTIVEENSRLKRELEYREVVISTLQESNNELRMKLAESHNCNSELRTKYNNHCNCCSRLSNKSSELKFTLDCAENLLSPSSVSTSRSLSPEPSLSFFEPCHYAQPPDKNTVRKVYQDSLEEDLSSSDDQADYLLKLPSGLVEDQSRELACNESNKQVQTGVQCNITEEQNVDPPSSHDCWELGMEQFTDNKVQNVDNNGCLGDMSDWSNNPTQLGKRHLFLDDFEDSSNKIYVVESPKSDGKWSFNNQGDCERLTESNENEIKSDGDSSVKDEKSEEKNGMSWIGGFKVWGNSSVKVCPKLCSDDNSPCSITVRSVINPHLVNPFTKENADSYSTMKIIKSRLNSAKHDVLNILALNGSESEPAFDVDIHDSSHENSLKTASPNNKFRKTPLDEGCRLMVSPIQTKFTNISSGAESVNISFSPKTDYSHLKFSQNVNDQRGSFTNSSSVSRNSSKKHSTVQSSASPVIKNKLDPRPVASSKENLSNLGISISKSDKNSCSNSVMYKWKTIKSKFERMSLGSLITVESPNKLKTEYAVKNSFIDVRDQSPSLLNHSKILNNSTKVDPECIRVSSPSSTPSVESDCAVQVPSSSLSVQECLKEANECARELSKGLSRLPSRLDYIRSIGKP